MKIIRYLNLGEREVEKFLLLPWSDVSGETRWFYKTRIIQRLSEKDNLGLDYGYPDWRDWEFKRP